MWRHTRSGVSEMWQPVTREWGGVKKNMKFVWRNLWMAPNLQRGSQLEYNMLKFTLSDCLRRSSLNYMLHMEAFHHQTCIISNYMRWSLSDPDILMYDCFCVSVSFAYVLSWITFGEGPFIYASECDLWKFPSLRDISTLVLLESNGNRYREII